jgi:energy-coupling factor transporter ATP-binding protein EcfA2
MIKIFDNIWLNSIIGAAFILFITVQNFFLSRSKTAPVTFLDQIFFSLIGCLFGWPCWVLSVLGLGLIVYIKWYNKNELEIACYDYSGTVRSISRKINMTKTKPGNDYLIVGNVFPTNYLELPNNMMPIKLNNQVLSGGMMLTGSTGSGKTTTLKSLLKQRLAQNRPVCFVDYKGQTDVLDDLKTFCQSIGMDYYEFSDRTCSFTYDPLVTLNETGRVEALLNTRRWSMDGADDHYKSSTQLLIQKVVREYDKYRQMEYETEESKNYLYGLYEYSRTYMPTPNERDGFNTFRKSLEIILTSGARDLFVGSKPKFSFEEDRPYLICFSFVSANKALASSISSFLFQDIMDRGTRNPYEDNLLLCVDEYGTLENSIIIKDILEKGRSGGIQTIFSLLDINQVAMTTSDHFVQAILGTINSFVIHAGATQETASTLSGVQKYEMEFDIMSLTKPVDGNPPTALFISKFPILNKRGSQETHRIIPYNFDYIGTKEIKEEVEEDIQYYEFPTTVDNSEVEREAEETQPTKDTNTIDISDFL